MLITNRDNTPEYKRDGIISHLLVSELTTGSKALTTSLVEMEEKGFQHIHSHSNEQSYFIIEGTGLMHVDGVECVVKKGDSVFIPSGASHGLINTGTGRLVYLSSASPSFGAEIESEWWPLKVNR